MAVTDVNDASVKMKELYNAVDTDDIQFSQADSITKYYPCTQDDVSNGGDGESMRTENLFPCSESLGINDIQFSQASSINRDFSQSEEDVEMKLETYDSQVNENTKKKIDQNSEIVSVDLTQTTSTVDDNNVVNKEQDSEILYSQVDEVLITMNARGELKEVIGNESMLSQELEPYMQLSQDTFSDAAQLESSQGAVIQKRQDPMDTNHTVTGNNYAENIYSIGGKEYQHSPYFRIRNDQIDHNLGSLLTAVHIVGSPGHKNNRRDYEEAIRHNFTLSPAKSSGKVKKLKKEKSPKKVDQVTKTTTTLKKSPLREKAQLRKNERKQSAKYEEVTLVSGSNHHKNCVQISPGTSSSTSITLIPKHETKQGVALFNDDKNKSSVQKDSKSDNIHSSNNVFNDDSDDEQIAYEAAALAGRVLKDPNLASRFLLSLILSREKPGKQLQETVISNNVAFNATKDNPYYMTVGFQWCDFPPLEEILKKNRKKYYELSMDPTLRQTVEQLTFNNRLVSLVRQVAVQNHWIFYQHGPKSNTELKHYNWTDKVLRDRIRFYYKTTLQNARGRLQTMLKNPSKRSNAKKWKELHQSLQEKKF